MEAQEAKRASRARRGKFHPGGSAAAGVAHAQALLERGHEAGNRVGQHCPGALGPSAAQRREPGGSTLHTHWASSATLARSRRKQNTVHDTKEFSRISVVRRGCAEPRPETQKEKQWQEHWPETDPEQPEGPTGPQPPRGTGAPLSCSPRGPTHCPPKGLIYCPQRDPLTVWVDASLSRGDPLTVPGTLSLSLGDPSLSWRTPPSLSQSNELLRVSG